MCSENRFVIGFDVTSITIIHYRCWSSLDGNRMMILLPKLLGLYKCPILEPRRLDAAAGSKKLQSQIFNLAQKSCDWSVTKHAFFVFQKSLALMMKRTFLAMLPTRCVFGNNFHHCPFSGMSGMGGWPGALAPFG